MCIRDRFKANPLHACTSCLQNSEPPQPSPSTTTPLIDNESNTLTLEQNNTLPRQAERVLSPQVSYLMNSLLRDVVKRGTGRRALSLGRTDLAGKTGTTNDQKDAWFSGFNPSLVAVTWVGFDDSRSLGSRETGGKASLPMWISFMREALKGTPNQNLVQPSDIVSVLIDSETGLKTEPSNPNAIFELFRQEYAPQNMLDNSNSSADSQQNIEDLF